MRVAWVSDFSQESKLKGGAEISEFLMMEEGRKRGHSITMFDSSLSINFDERLYNYDLFVINNILRFNKEQIRKIRDNLMVPYINYLHDYNFCKYRNADCMFYNCSLCDNGNNPDYHWFGKLFDNAIFNVFLSPLHLKLTVKKYPNLTNSVIIPSPIDLSKFKPNNVQAKGNYLYFGNIYKGKGIDKVLKEFKDKGKKLCFAGQFWDPSFKEEIMKDHTYLGEIPYDKIPELLNNFEYFIRYTPLKESFGRSTVEALACGCKIISNNKIGADSFDCSEKELIEKCDRAPKVFWDKIEKVIKNEK